MTDVRYIPSTKAGVKAYLQEIQQAVARRPADTGRQSNLLALSGGGDNGAFGAGLLVGWSQRGDRPMFDQVTGISTGALIAHLLFWAQTTTPPLRRCLPRFGRKIFTGSVASSVFC